MENNMKKTLFFILGMSIIAFNAQASKSNFVAITYADDGIFRGRLTFNDNYNRLLSVTGSLTGGTPNYAETLDRAWDLTINPTSPGAAIDRHTVGIATDFFINTVSPTAPNFSDWDFFMQLDWDYTASLTANKLVLADANNLNSNTIGGQSEIYATEFSIGSTIDSSPVPLPTAVWLFGSALIGIVGMKKKSSTL